MDLPDELSLEEMQALRGQTPDEVSPEVMQRLLDEEAARSGSYEIQLDELEEMGVPREQALPETLTLEEMRQALLDERVSGQRSDRLLEGLGTEGPVSALQAANTLAAAQEYYKKERGWLSNAFYTLTIPEQFIARQAINLLENVGAMTTEDARDLLSRDQVHGSDIVNFYYKDPKSFGEKALRFGLGLAADILLDPLSYVGIGALTKAGKAAQIGGKVVDLSTVSKGERARFKTLEAVEKVLKADEGKLMGLGDDAETAIRHNEMAIAKARDEMLGFDKLESELLLSPQAREKYLETVRKGMTEKSWADEWWEGERGLTLGARVPFTNLAVEVDLPGAFSKLGALPLKALDATFDFTKTYFRSLGLGDAFANVLSDIGTKTGKYIFDDELNTRLGSFSALKERLGDFQKRANLRLSDRKKALGDEGFKHLLGDILDEMELGVRGLEEAEELAKTFNYKGDLGFLTTRSAEDTARLERLSQHPGILDLIQEMREMMREGVQAYKARGLPFEELNPFGPGWARDYLAHEISDEFLRRFKEVNLASDVIGEAMKVMPELIGKVDPSSMSRRYRGTIREANAKSLEKYGVKMFVDDPIELVVRRVEEMHKVIKDHDLMEAALPYAIKREDLASKAKRLTEALERGEISKAQFEAQMKEAGRLRGYVEFNPEHFKNLTIDKSDQFQVKWDAFIPKAYKTSEKIYLPEDVYDRLLFSINGWNKSKPMTKILAAADVYTSVWRNNALFGAGYIGLNAFSNAITYLSFNDRGGPIALAKATMALTPWAKGVKVNSPLLGEITGESLFKMALEDNVLASSFARKMTFSDFAEHVASNRKARHTIGQKVRNAADIVFLWRYSRGLAQFADEVPKLAVYISRLEQGFSRKGAAEAAERMFYNFNNMSRIQSAVATAIPFSSFPMKTAELVKETFKSGHLSSLTIPGKVQAILEGAFVQDHDVRGALDQMLPGYKNVLHPVHGVLMPGMRELVIDVPWTYTTMQTLFNPEDSNHPIATLFHLMGALKTKTEEVLGLQTEMDAEQAVEQRRRVKHIFSQTLDLAIPSYLREALTIAEINGSLDLGGYFKDRYTPNIPTRSQFERALSDRALVDQGSVVHKFVNAADFGKAMDEKYGEDWLYNLIFHDRIEGDDLAALQQAATRGEYIRRKMRQISLGSAAINKLDSNFFMNLFAIKRQINLKSQQLKSEILDAGALMDTERISEPEFLERLQDQWPLAKELMALHYKKSALIEYYEFFLGADKKFPGVDLLSVLLGLDEYEFDYGDKPDKEVYENLFKGKTIRNISDEDAADVVEAIYDQESL